MEWKGFSENGKEQPYKIIEREIQGFSNFSNQLVELELHQYKERMLKYTSLDRDFQFALNLRSKYVKDYSLQIFTFGYNVDLEKVKLIIEESIHNEVCKIFKNPKTYIILANNKNFTDFVDIIFTSKRFTSILTGLMKIAETNKNDGKT